LFGTGHKFVPGTAMYWQFGVKKSSESWFSCKKASWRRASCSTCTECYLLYNLADLYSAGICCCWLCIQVFLRGGYSTVVLASLIMSKLASTKKARSHCSKYLCIIIRITKSHISLAHMYSENKKMKNRNGRTNIKLCNITCNDTNWSRTNFTAQVEYFWFLVRIVIQEYLFNVLIICASKVFTCNCWLVFVWNYYAFMFSP
jgi:hypothetical protein